MKKYQSLAAIGAASLLTLGLAACAGGGGDAGGDTAAPTEGGGSDLSLAYVYGNSSDPFWTTIQCGAEAEAEARGVDLEVFSTPDLDAAKFQQSLDSARAKSPSGLMINSLNPNQFIAQYQSLMTEGVPVVAGQVTEPPATLATVWSSGESEGFIEDLLTLVPEGGGKVIVLGGVQGLVPVETRYLPVVEAIQEERPDLEFLETQYSQFDTTKAQSITSGLLVANPDVSLVIAADGPDGQGAAAAVKAANLTDTVKVISFDATPSNVEGLKAGDFIALVSQNAQEIGKQQLGQLVDYLEANPDGGAVEATDEFVGIPQGLLTPENVDAPENATYVYTASCS